MTIAALNALNFGQFSHPINHTFIALVPKKKNLVSIIEYRPISLCNIIYKLISKMAANRLKGILTHVISLS